MSSNIFLNVLLIGAVYAFILFFSCFLVYKKRLKPKRFWINYLMLSIYSFFAFLSAVFIFMGTFQFKDITSISSFTTFVGTIGMAVFIGLIIFKMQDISGTIAKIENEKFINGKFDQLSIDIDEKLKNFSEQINKNFSKNLNDISNLKFDQLSIDIDEKLKNFSGQINKNFSKNLNDISNVKSKVIIEKVSFDISHMVEQQSNKLNDIIDESKKLNKTVKIIDKSLLATAKNKNKSRKNI